MSRPTPRDSYHPGPPKFLQVGDRIVDPIFVDGDHGFDRDAVAPTIKGTPRRDPDTYTVDDFTWSVASKPDGSTAELAYGLMDYDEGVTEYDHGLHNTAEFEPDEPGTYVLELDAPDGSHELTVHVFGDVNADARPPGETAGVGGSQTGVGGGAGGPPRLELDGTYDEQTDEFIIESNPELAPDSHAVESDLAVEFLPHDASSLESDDITVTDNWTARIPAAALDEQTSIYAAPFDGRHVGVTDQIVLNPDQQSISLPNRPPAWLDDAVIYEIFTRSFAGEPGGTDFEFLTDRVAYLDELGIDVVWLTPIVPAWSPTVETPPGGPHGYSTGDYFDIADDLGTLELFESFVEACHEHDIKVCFDLVVNHCGWTHEFFQETIAKLGPEPDDPYRFPDIEAWDEESAYFDWFDRRNEATEHDAKPAQTGFFGGRLQPNLNYGNITLREHILAVVDFWSDIVDMFRCDIAWGVPHSFWTEVRECIREKDTEFVLLEETIPRRAAFAGSEFDLHFDTHGFTYTAQAVVRGNRPPSDLLDAIEARQNDGFPAFSRVLNATENHDEARLFHEASANGHRADPAQAQRAATAAAVTLPGVPLLYYGQERLISEYGTRRPRPYDEDESRTDDIEADPYKRAFMNWEVCPDDHFQFYRSLIQYYHDSPVLAPTADLVHPAYRTDSPEDVLVFGRVTDHKNRIIVINFAAETRTVDLRPVVDTTNQFTGEDIGLTQTDDAVTVEVDTLAVLETPTLFNHGG